MLAGAAMLVLLTSATERKDSDPKTLGFVLTGLWYTLHETPGGKLECPAGFNAETLQQFRAQFPTEEEQNRQFLVATDYQSRGPDGANTTHNPDLAGPEPLPAHYVTTNVGTGLDLDSAPGGSATAGTCPHEEFTSPDGETGIDNQMYRVLGCIAGFRSSGFHTGIHQQDFRDYVATRTLLEISGVDDEQNDDHVEVTIYKGRDTLLEDSSGKFTPFQTQRIDSRLNHTIHRATGRIADGVLITDPIELDLPYYVFVARGHIQLHDMRLRLKLGETEASGQMAGYSDIERWYSFFVRGIAGTDYLGGVSAPTIYRGLHRFADGYKNPESGKCTAISTSYDLKFIRAFIVGDRK